MNDGNGDEDRRRCVYICVPDDTPAVHCSCLTHYARIIHGLLCRTSSRRSELARVRREGSSSDGFHFGERFHARYLGWRASALFGASLPRSYSLELLLSAGFRSID